MTLRPLGWWRLAQALIESLTRPPTDVAAADRELERLLRGSALVGVGQACMDAFTRAWTHSATRALARWMWSRSR